MQRKSFKPWMEKTAMQRKLGDKSSEPLMEKTLDSNAA